MGESVKYQGEEIKIGTCENLYYATYLKYVAALQCLMLYPEQKTITTLKNMLNRMPVSGSDFPFPMKIIYPWVHTNMTPL